MDPRTLWLSVLLGFVLLLALLVGFFLLIRALVLWYLQIGRRTEALEDIAELLRQIRDYERGRSQEP